MVIKICKILLAVLSYISFLGVAFFTFIYFYDGLDYMYYSQGVVTAVVEKLPEEVSCSFCFYTPLRSLTVVP